MILSIFGVKRSSFSEKEDFWKGRLLNKEDYWTAKKELAKSLKALKLEQTVSYGT